MCRVGEGFLLSCASQRSRTHCVSKAPATKPPPSKKIPLFLENAVVRPLNFIGSVMALTLHVCLNPGEGARVTPDEMDLSPSLRVRIGAFRGCRRNE